MCAYVSATGYFPCNKKAPSCEKDEAYTRVTTFVHKRLTPSISASVRQHSGADNVRHSVAAYWNMLLAVKYRKKIRHVRCAARGCIQTKVPARLSSAGCFLFIPLNPTSSRQSLLFTLIIVIIGAGEKFVNRFLSVDFYILSRSFALHL